MNRTLSASDTIYKHHTAVIERNLTTGCSTAAAAFLIIGAISVIMGACLCLTLPGINVMTDIVGPAIFPSLLAIALSVPFIITARKSDKKQQEILEARDEAVITLCEGYNILDMSREALFKFIKETLLSGEWHKPGMEMDRHKLFKVIRERYDSEKGFKKKLQKVEELLNKKSHAQKYDPRKL